MMRRSGLVWIWLMLPLWLMAQTQPVPNEVNKKRIRELKLSEQYLYAEAVMPVNQDEAKACSKELLQVQIVGILISDCNFKKKEADRKWNAVMDKCESIAVQTGDLFKVFTYIPKETVVPGFTQKKDDEEQDEAKSIILQFRNLPDNEQTVLKEVSACKNFKELILLLKQKKAHRQVEYGSLQNAKSLEQAYLIILKQGTISALLGKGGDERVNLMNNAPDSLKNYIGQTVVWLKIY